MAARYDVQLICMPDDIRADEVERALADQIRAHGLHLYLDVRVIRVSPDDVPNVVVYLGNTVSAVDAACVDQVRAALASGRLVIPVVSSAEHFREEVPEQLGPLNAHFWNPGGVAPLVRTILEELGIEQRQRRVFISHRREDGLIMAEQLHDALTHQHFEPFIDRFEIATGADVQEVIADALEDDAFLLLIESASAANSRYVFYEVEYALSHQMGLCIISWPDAPSIPGTVGIPRVSLSADDLIEDRGYRLLTPAALERVVAAIEENHAVALVRRRRNLFLGVQEALTNVGADWTALPKWRLLISGATSQLVGIATRLPSVDDLHELDAEAEAILGPARGSVLVHSARKLRPERLNLLSWATSDRTIALLPENAVGGYW